jgi:uncharacterized membrane protein YfcA
MFVFLAITSLITSMASGVAGMGGGIILLSLLSFFLAHHEMIAIHGIIQLISNSSRLIYLKQYMRLDFFIPFLIGSPIGYIISFYLFSKIEDHQILYFVLSLLMFYSVFRPKQLPCFKLTALGWFILGVITSILGPLIGAIGPLLAPFFLRDDITKEEIVATKSSMQFLIHLLKIPLFISLSFSYQDHMYLILVMGLFTVLGTHFGVRVLKRIEVKIFMLIFKTMLLLSAIRMQYNFWME